MDLAQQRQQAHAYLDQLTPIQISAIRSLLESMISPLGTAIHEPSDDQETAARSLHWLAKKRDIPLEAILADYGMSLEDFERLTSRAAKSKTAGHE